MQQCDGLIVMLENGIVTCPKVNRIAPRVLLYGTVAHSGAGNAVTVLLLICYLTCV